MSDYFKSGKTGRHFVGKNNPFHKTREEVTKAVQEYLESGGKITKAATANDLLTLDDSIEDLEEARANHFSQLKETIYIKTITRGILNPK
tara:strand:+ start:209 stop:478 length:270 start_codon:yes stop_codon:yes gene_type:complete